MKFTSALAAVAAIAAATTLAACGQSEAPAADAAPEAPQAPAVETPEQVAARVAASMTPLEYALRQVSCNEAMSAAKRAREGSFTPELTAKVAETERMDFIKLTRAVRELGGDHTAINTAQRAIITLPQRVENVTPEYVAQTEECLAIVTVESARQKAAE